MLLLSLLSASQMANFTTLECRAMDVKVAHLETTRDLSRTWLTVDMDAFFAACEELDNPALVQSGPLMKCTMHELLPNERCG